MPEVRVMSEGAVRWVQASGVGSSWATASAPTSGFYGFITNFSFTSAQEIATVSERGIPNHHKRVSKTPPEVTMTYLWTGTVPSALTASGASVPAFHLEFRANEGENLNSGRYFQFHGAVLTNRVVSEADQGNTVQDTYRCLGMVGPTASGYLG